MDSDSDDFGSDDFGDINDDELIAAATQAELAAHSHQRPPHSAQQNSSAGDVNGNGGGDDNLFLSDDFDSDVELPGALVAPQSSDYGSQRPPPSTGQLRQATLFGGRVPDEPPGSSARPRNVHCYPLASTQAQEPPTHHKIDREAAKTWVYPSNVSHREYQYSIVHKALFSNILVALPTGTLQDTLTPHPESS
jgi:ATP-dependent DNA helicase MPH1